MPSPPPPLAAPTPPGALAARLGAQEEVLATFVDTLQAHISNCVRLGRFIEAEVARRRLDEVHASEAARRREALKSRQLAEALGLEQAYMAEFAAFNAARDARADAFEAGAAATLTATRQRHAAALRDFQQKLLARGQAPRHSKAYRDLRHVQDMLARARHYEAAGAMKGKADEMLAAEEERWYRERQDDMLRKEALFRDKLALEVGSLKKRMAGHRAEMNRTRQGELERLLQRYANVKSQLEREHKSACAALDKALALEELARRAEASRRGAADRAR